ncbi:MAG: hypothetical protein ABJQ23_09780 [Shimia thalassica]|uniref:hypothetical protein n=1 Tax=Shimia thalassica TaxID=1715693 RepID=UPI00329720D1
MSNLDDADALEEMRAAHAAFCEDKRLESEKDRIEAELKAAGDRLVAALAGYGKLHDLPWPFDPPSPVGFQIKD